MPAIVTWDQTLVAAGLAALAAVVAYLAAARFLRRQAAARELRLGRDALLQVLALLDGPAGEYLRDPSQEYPQRDMLELERRALQAQILFWRDLALQRALQAVSDPAGHAAAAAALREASRGLDRELGALGG